MQPVHLLLLDSDPLTHQSLQAELQAPLYHLISVTQSADLFDALETKSCHLVLMDLNLADEDGFGCLSRVRQISEVPLIVLTSRQDEASRIRALELGADDYLLKPCLPLELALRIRNLVRRHHQDETKPLSFNGWRLQKSGMQLVHLDGRQLPLTLAEFAILEILYQAQGAVVSREQLFEELQNKAHVHSEKSINALIYRVRKKMGDSKRTNPIITLGGVGYYLALH